MPDRYWVALHSILRKEIIRFMRIWMQTLVPPIITMGLYFVIFGHVMGQQIGTIIEGVSYLQFIVPGLIMMAVITHSYANVAASFFSAKFNRSIEELLIAPVPTWVIILGYVAGGVARGLTVGLLVALISLLFTPWQLHAGWVVIATLLLTSMIFSLSGLINAVYAESFDSINIVPTLILTPLTYLGGIFYSLTLLPPFWQAISKLNPIAYMVNVMRFAWLGVADLPLCLSVMVQLVLVALLYGLAWHLIERGRGLRS